MFSLRAAARGWAKQTATPQRRVALIAGVAGLLTTVTVFNEGFAHAKEDRSGISEEEAIDIAKKRLQVADRYTVFTAESTSRHLEKFNAFSHLEKADNGLKEIAAVRNDDTGSVAYVVHLGNGLCGHRGIVHGGILGLLFDDVTGVTAILQNDRKPMVTANLTVNYRKPTYANNTYIVQAEITKEEGRKKYIDAHISGIAADATPLAHASALYIKIKSI